MKYHETPLPGLFVISPEPIEDERGFFARIYCAEEFARRGLEPAIAQSSIAYSARRGTLRGMHYQRDPFGEVKLIRCTRGAIYDVAVDLRPASPSFRRWFGIVLDPDRRDMVYIPRGIAHGYQSLEDGTEVSYHMSTAHRPDAAAGVRWDDPAFGIDWPLAVTVIAERDRTYPDFPLPA